MKLIAAILTILALALVPARAQVVYGGQSIPTRPSIPSDSIGVDNSYYWDFTTSNVYGPKTLGQWPSTPIPQQFAVPLGPAFGGTGTALTADPTGVADSTANLNTIIAAAIAAGKTSLDLIPGGTYAISGTGQSGVDGTYGVFISGASNGFTLDCHGSTLLWNSGQTIVNNADHISIQNSSNVTIRNCNVDSKYLPFSQTTVTNIGADYADFTIFPGYDISWTTLQQVEIRQCPLAASLQLPAGYPLALNLIYNLFGNGTSNGGAAINRAVTSLGGGVYRVAYTGNDTAALSSLTVGQCALLMHQKNGSDAIHAYNVNNLKIVGTRVYAAAGSGIYAALGQDIDIVDSGTQIKPGTDRWMSSTSDNHIGLVGGTHKYLGFIGQGNGDDGLNDFGVVKPVSSVTDANHVSVRQFVTGYGGPTIPVVGDLMRFLTSGGILSFLTTITAVSCDGTNCALTLAGSGAPGIDTTYYAYDQTQSAQILTFKSGYFNMIRGHGLVFNALASHIVGNTFDHVTNGAVFCPQMAYGFNSNIQAQGPFCNDVSIEGNNAEFVNYEQFTSAKNGLGGDPGVYEIYVSSQTGLVYPSAQNGLLSSHGNTCKNTNNYCEFYSGYVNIDASGDNSQFQAGHFQSSDWTSGPAAFYVTGATTGRICNSSPPATGVGPNVLAGSGQFGVCPRAGYYVVAMTNGGSYALANDATNVLLTGTPSTVTVTLPPNPDPGSVITLLFSGGVGTTLTVAATNAPFGTPALPGANATIRYMYNQPGNLWTLMK